ncbi:beta-N-acetylhexosaminidase, partial [Clostridium perfringens]
MKFRFEGAVTDVMPGIQLLLDELGVELGEDGVPVQIDLSEGDLEVGRDRTHAYIRYGRRHQFFRGLGLLVQHSRQSDTFHLRERQQFDQIGPMFDLTRNAVLTVDSFKLMLNKMALMG